MCTAKRSYGNKEARAVIRQPRAIQDEPQSIHGRLSPQPSLPFNSSKHESTTNRAMNSRSSSISFPPPRSQTRPSFSSRLSFAITNAEQGEAGTAPNPTEHQIDEEIEEIKRYEVYALVGSFWFGHSLVMAANTMIGFHYDR